jgi:hypothetical protein
VPEKARAAASRCGVRNIWIRELPDVLGEIQHDWRTGEGPIVAIVSGGNVDLAKYCELVEPMPVSH